MERAEERVSESVASAIVGEFERHSLERAYCVPGESYLAVLDALYSSTIPVVTCRQEGGAAYMAMAEGRLTGKPGLVMVTRGPGAANAMIGIHCAYEEGIPLVALVGLPALSSRGTRAFQEFEFQQWFSTTTKDVLVIDEPAHARWAVDNSIRLANSGRPGPVAIGVPEDVLKWAVEPAGERSLPNEGPGKCGLATFTDQAQQLSDTVNSSQRPVMVVGDHQLSEKSSLRLEEWCQQRSIPIVADFRSYGLVDNSADVYVGALGVGKGWAIPDWIAKSDLLVYMGCVRSDINSDHVSEAFDKPTIVVGSSEMVPFHSGRLDHLIEVPSENLCGAMGFTKQPSSVPTERAEWLREGREAYLASQDVERAIEPYGRLERYHLTARLTGVIRDLLPKGTVVTYGAGTYTGVPQSLIPAKGYKTVAGTLNGSMGYGIPAAVAAKLARPASPVISYAGDGDFLMNGQELATAVMQKAPIVVIVVDNSRYGTIQDHQQREFPGRVSGTLLKNPNFEYYAKSFGCDYLTAEDVVSDPSLFSSALNSEVPTIIYANESDDSIH